MYRVIIDAPGASWPKFPRVIEAETEDRLKQRIIRCLRGLKGWSTPEEYAAITVTRVIGTADVTASYVPGAAE